MLIGDLAERCGVSPRALRNYEKLGLIHPIRDGSGYREYDESAARAVTELRSLTELGFSLAEAKPFLDCLYSGQEVAGACLDSLASYRAKLAEIDAYLDRLHRVRDRLAADLTRAVAARAAGPRCEFTTAQPR